MALHPSQAQFSPDKPAKSFVVLILRIFATFRLVHLEWDVKVSKNGKRHLKATTNLTILNAILVFRGVSPLPLRKLRKIENGKASPPRSEIHISEYSLWWHMMIFQVFCSILAFAARYWIAKIIFP